MFLKYLEKLALEYNDGWGMVVLGTLYCGEIHPIADRFSGESFPTQIKKGLELIEDGEKLAADELQAGDYNAMANALMSSAGGAVPGIRIITMAIEYREKQMKSLSPERANLIPQIESIINTLRQMREDTKARLENQANIIEGSTVLDVDSMLIVAESTFIVTHPEIWSKFKKELQALSPEQIKSVLVPMLKGRAAGIRKQLTLGKRHEVEQELQKMNAELEYAFNNLPK
jgi:hypothetical protein